MTRLLRIAASSGGAAAITVSLLWVMQFLVGNARPGDPARTAAVDIQFREVRPPAPPEPPVRRRPPKPEPVDEPPPAPRLAVSDTPKPKVPAPSLAYNVVLPLHGTGPALFLGDGTNGRGSGPLIPLLRIHPAYPYRAALAGIEGWVRVEFTVTETGAVTDPRVVESKPSEIFDEAAVKAITRWRFEPRRVNGEAVAARAAQTFDFNLAAAETAGFQ